LSSTNRSMDVSQSVVCVPCFQFAIVFLIIMQRLFLHSFFHEGIHAMLHTELHANAHWSNDGLIKTDDNWLCLNLCFSLTEWRRNEDTQFLEDPEIISPEDTHTIRQKRPWYFFKQNYDFENAVYFFLNFIPPKWLKMRWVYPGEGNVFLNNVSTEGWKSYQWLHFLPLFFVLECPKCQCLLINLWSMWYPRGNWVAFLWWLLVRYFFCCTFLFLMAELVHLVL
jgi:hypothetical protein